MGPLTSTKKELLDTQRPLKYMQVVDTIISHIDGGLLRVGDRLPSINDACVEWYLSKDSVRRAYETLFRLGVITSVNRKGYYITENAKRRTFRLLLITARVSDSVKQLTDAITRVLGRKVLIDICTFDGRRELFCQMVEKQLGNYHYIMILPHLPEADQAIVRCLQNIPKSQLILAGDSWRPITEHGFRIFYGGEAAVFDSLSSQVEMLCRYQRLNLVLPEDDSLDAHYLKAFRRFAEQNSLEYQLLDELEEDDVRAGEAYFVADNLALTNLIQVCDRRGLQPGKDIGLVSLFENEYTQLLAGGVSVISYPWQEIGTTVARILRGELQPAQPQTLPLFTRRRATC